ncbi:alpha/beta fold hydrolase [uncultured Hoeflea sp.]|uniref:alpha/beta hydrolase n=1 Tax=uncultured Hoeflea sp. TaxID=538666 RepID=UPI00260763BC|nr:alpha/beta fold hydrolase [uncultured Hoeflea sp.]
MTSLSACTARGTLTTLPDTPDHQVQQIIAATNRVSLDSAVRADRLSFSKIDVAVPEHREIGTVPVSGANAFSVLSRQNLDTEDALRAALQNAPRNAPLTLWIHGYNNTAAEAIYRQAQLAIDAKMEGAQVTFVWPSAATARGYVHDRDSVLHARQPLSDLLDTLDRVWPGDIVLVAHSLGAFLAMETLSWRNRGGHRANINLRGLVLLQPDIATDVFRAQVAGAGPLPELSVVVASDADPALWVSARVSQSDRRLGAHTDPDFYMPLGFRLLDVSGISDASQPHLVAFSSQAFLSYLSRLQRSDLS